MNGLSVDFNNGIIKSVPIVGGAGVDVMSKFYGLTLSEWFYAAVIVYTIAQTGCLIFNTYVKYKSMGVNKNNG